VASLCSSLACQGSDVQPTTSRVHRTGSSAYARARLISSVGEIVFNDFGWCGAVTIKTHERPARCRWSFRIRSSWVMSKARKSRPSLARPSTRAMPRRWPRLRPGEASTMQCRWIARAGPGTMRASFNGIRAPHGAHMSLQCSIGAQIIQACVYLRQFHKKNPIYLTKPLSRIDVTRGRDCRQFYFDVQDECISSR